MITGNPDTLSVLIALLKNVLILCKIKFEKSNFNPFYIGISSGVI